MSKHIIEKLSISLRKVFLGEHLPPEEYIGACDSVLKMCIEDKEKSLIELLFDICFGYIEETRKKLDTLIELCDFMKGHPMADLPRDLNNNLVEILWSDVEDYMAIRKSCYQKYTSMVSRIASYLNRFWMSNMTICAEQFVYHAKRYQYRSEISLMLLDFWEISLPRLQNIKK